MRGDVREGRPRWGGREGDRVSDGGGGVAVGGEGGGEGDDDEGGGAKRSLSYK